MYLAGVSVLRVEDISETLWGSRVSTSTTIDLKQKAYVHIEKWRNRKLSGKSICLCRRSLPQAQPDGEFENVSILVVIGVDEYG